MSTGRPVPTPRKRSGADHRKWLLVQNLPDDISCDTLMFYFESKRQFGRELAVEHVDLQTSEDGAVVTFEQARDAQNVIETHKITPCQLDGKTLEIELIDIEEFTRTKSKPLKPEKKEPEKQSRCTTSNADVQTIEVKGFKETSTEESLQYYFENTRRSGGGPVTICRLDKLQKCLLLQFEDQKVTETVLSRHHEVESCTLELRIIDMNNKLLVFSDLADSISDDLLGNFLEARLSVPVKTLIMYRDIQKASVLFEKQIDFEKVCEVCKKEIMYGVHITPHHVPVTHTIRVTGLPDVEHETVERYFENKYVSNGGEIKKAKFYADESYCLLTFTYAEVVEKVCEKKVHKIKGEKVDVEPYLEILQQSKPIPSKLPDPIELMTEDTNKIKYVKRLHHGIEERLVKCKAKMNWNTTPLTVECSLDLSNAPERKLVKTWKEGVLAVVEDYFNELAANTKDIDADIWGPVMEVLGAVILPDEVSQVVAMFVEDNNHCVKLVGPKAKLDKAWTIILEAIEEVEEKCRQEKERVSEEKVWKPWQIQYIIKAGLVKETTARFEGLTIDIPDEEDGVIVFTGAKETVKNAAKEMLKRIRKVQRREVEIEPLLYKLVQSSHVQGCIKQAFSDQYIEDTYVVTDGSITFFAKEEDLDQMESAFWDIISIDEIPIDSKKAELLESQRWEKLLKSLTRKHGDSMAIDEKRGKIKVYTVAELRDEIVEELDEFFAENAVYTKQLKVLPYIVKYIQKVARKRYDQEIQSLRGQNVVVDLDEDKGMVTVEGTSNAVKKGIEIIQNFESSIAIHNHTIQHQRINEYFVSVKGKECLLKIQETIPCIVHVRDVTLSTGNSTVERFDKLVCCAEVNHTSGVKIQVYGGDIISLNPDVLVNAANKHLTHNGGLAKVIVNKGGRRIVEACKDHIRDNGPLADGEVFVSTAGRLHSNIIVHAVGPRWSGGGNGESDKLKMAITESLKTASSKKKKTIAIPALCTGKFGYPVKLACRAIVEAVDAFLQDEGSSLQKVYFCDINVPTVQAFTAALKDIGQSVQLHGNLPSGDDKPRDRCSFGNVRLSIVNGVLVKQRVDVIVNSTAKSLKLDSGRSSAALLRAAGNTIQQECQQKYPDGIQYGEVAVTSGGNLKCSHVFHVAINKYDRKDSASGFQQIDQCVTTCLQEANKLGLKSIAFPAMGTGLQKYPKQEVARQMIKSVQNFCSNNTGTSLNNIQFVIYTGEDNTYDAFCSEVMIHHSGDSTGQQQSTETCTSDDKDTCQVTIYANNRQDASKAVRKLEETAKKEWKINKITDSNIHKLSDNDIKKLKATVQDKNVSITVDTDIGSVEIIGVDVDVLEIANTVTEKLRSIEKWDSKKEKAWLLGKTVRWFYVNNQQDCPFPDVTNFDIENAYKQSKPKVKVKDGKKVEYEITFASMTEVEVNNTANTFQVKRKDLKAAGDVGIPKFWQPMAAGEKLAMVPLAAGSPEYQKVVTDFQRTLGRVPTILKIERVQNKTWYAQYMVKRANSDQTTPNFEQILWHGTAEATIPQINLNGFNRSYSGSALKGVYFAVNASYSDNGYARVCSDGYKRMYRCLVLTGKTSSQSAGALGPAPINPSNPHVLHDSVSYPGMYIIFNDTQAYPEHMITYK